MKKDNQNNEIIIYEGDNGQLRIEVHIENETVWLTQIQLAELFGTTKANISLHVKNIFEEGELTKEATVKEYLTVQKEGNREVSRDIDYYNLDSLLSDYGEGILIDSGKISHEKAIERAEKEYRKYQAKTLSPVEKEYLESIKLLEKKVEKKIKYKK